MKIVLCCDRNWYQYLPTVCNSILTNNPDAMIQILCEDDYITSIQHPQVNFLNVSNIKTVIDDDPRYKTYHLPRMTFMRLSLERLVPDDKVIYLDTDLIVDGSLKPLWDMDENKYMLGGCIDKNCVRFQHIYFNAGVLVISLKQWRQIQFEKQASTLLKYRYFSLGDQDIINELCTTKLEFPNCFNYGIHLRDQRLTQPLVVYHSSWRPKVWEDTRTPLWNKYYVKELIR